MSRYAPEAVAGLGSSAPVISLGSGFLFTTLVASYVWRERARRSRVEALVEQRTAELSGVNRSHAQESAVIVIDARGIVDQFNPAAERMTGYPAAEIIGQNVSILAPPNLRAEHDGYIGRDLRTGEARIIGIGREVGVCRKDGSVFPGALVIAEWSAGGRRYFTGILRDLTSQKRAQRERTMLDRQLRQAQKMEAIGNLTGGMAHDFNNLLGIIIGNIDLLRDLKKDDSEVAELTQDALDAALRGAELTRRLLAFARRQPLQPQRVDVNELVSGITRLLRRTLGENIEISLDLAASAWPTVVDPAQIEASLLNLANNSRDAMPNGGQLIIITANRQLDVDYAAQHAEVVAGDYVLIEVSDTGAGMTQAVVSRIFEPFFTTKERDRGTGLGLSMVFGFVKQSGGHISVYSEPGVGTVFRLYLPRMTADVATTEESFVPPLVRGGGETVLVVEDNAPLRRVVMRQLGELGYRVAEAKNAAAALALMQQENIDLLLTDIVMPGGTDGVELARQARQGWSALKVVFTSGFAEAQINGTARSLPPDARLLTKPYRREELAAIVRAALEG